MSGEINLKLSASTAYAKPVPDETGDKLPVESPPAIPAEGRDALTLANSEPVLTQRHEQILGAINFYMSDALKRYRKTIQQREKLTMMGKLLRPVPKLPDVTLKEIGYFLALTYPRERWNERGVIHTRKLGFGKELETLLEEGYITARGKLDRLNTRVKITAKGEAALSTAMAKSATERSNRPSGEDTDMVKFSCCL